MHSHCRQYPPRRQESLGFDRTQGIYQRVAEQVVGTKGTSNCQDMAEEGNDPYMQEHIGMIDSVRGDGPHVNAAMEVAESTMTCIMGREVGLLGT